MISNAPQVSGTKKTRSAKPTPAAAAPTAKADDIYHGPGRPVVFEGTTYKNLRQFCAAKNLNYHAISKRLKKSPSLHSALRRPSRNMAVTVFGVHYLSLAEACTVHTVAHSSAEKLMWGGRSAEEAIAYLKSLKQSFVFEGKEYRTFSSLAQAANVPYRNLHFLTFNRGFPVAVAVEMLRAIEAPICYDGRSFDSLKHLCDVLKLNIQQVCSPFYAGKSLIESIALIDGKRRPRYEDDVDLPTPIVVRRITLKTLGEVADYYAIPRQLLVDTVGDGKIEVSAAVRLIKLTGRRVSPDVYLYDGIEHDGLAALSRHCGLPYKKLYSLIVEKQIDPAIAIARCREEMGHDRAIVLRDGSRFETLKAFCLHFDVSRTSLGREMTQNPGMSFEDAALAIVGRSQPNSRRGKLLPVTYEGISYSSLRGMCTSLGIDYWTIYWMVKHGAVMKGLMTFEEAVASLKK